jgi:predicted cupin superfamily sugar epimerase
VFLTNALVDMYAKCGLVSHAELVFDLALQGNARRGDVMLLTEMYGERRRHVVDGDVWGARTVQGGYPDVMVSCVVTPLCYGFTNHLY